MNQLTIADHGIRQDPEGRYRLNDLHEAAGGEKRHEPNRFLRLESTEALVRAIENTHIRAISAERGRNRGTFVCKQLVYQYAMWISPEFNLKVIRAFDAMTTGKAVAVAEPDWTNAKTLRGLWPRPA